MNRRAAPLLLFLVALAPRLFGLRWDQGLLFHPDERRIAEAVTQISFAPLHLDPGFYAYGSLPFYLTRAAMALGRPFGAPQGYEGAILAGRVLSAFWGALGVVALFLLARRLHGERVALRAGLSLALAVLPLQNAHFATNDVALATLVTLTLALLVAAAEEGRVLLFAAAGALFGLALATKVSALPAAGAAVVALFFAARRSTARALGAGAAFGAAALAAFALGEPYAFRDAPAFLAAVAEQGRMVRDAGAVPYTIQYVGTFPYLYPAKELLLWGLGPFLGLAAAWGTWRALRGWRTPAVAVILGFLLPFLAITGSFGVKFPRYLLPAYPPLLLFAAAALEDLRGRAGRLARGAVLAGAALYAFAFLSIHARPHTVRTASRWVDAHLPAGARVLTTTWEEGFPDDPSRYRVVPFPFYDADSPEKTARLARELAEADAIAFPTKRIYGAILRDPARFPDSARFFRLLFAGDLGFALAERAASRPRLLGLAVPDELADESFSVYDHPLVFVFTKSARLPRAELERRLLSGWPHRVLTRDDVLRGAPERFASRALPDRAVTGSLAALLLFGGLVAALAVPGAALARRAFGESPGAAALGPVLGVTLFAWLAFLGGSAGVPLVRPFLLALAAALLLAGLALSRGLPRLSARERTLAIGVPLAAFLLFAALRAQQPEIYWGEKPMDFSILNALGRSETLPAPEPWFAGSALRYTYLGHFTLAALGKALGIAPGVLFNLGVALAAALFASALLFAGSACGGTLRAGLGAVLLGLLAGNLAGPLELLRRCALDFDFFWAVSRVVPGAINEFPFWSFLFADLHAHVLALPLAAAAAGAILRAASGAPSRGALAATALLLGALFATNGWSVPTFAALTPLLLVAGAWREAGSAAARLARGAGRALLVGVGGILAFAPFWSAWEGPARQWGWERDAFARPHEALLVFGPFVLLLLPLLWAGLRALVPWRAAALAAVPLLALAVLVDVRALLHGTFAEAASARALAALLALLLAAACASAGGERERRAALLAAAAFGIVLVCETAYLWDRMNTVFKFWLDAWVLLAVACGVFAAEALARPLRRPLAAAGIVLALATSGLALAAFLPSRHVEGPRGTLDGTAYLTTHRPDDAAAIAWLNRNVRGLPTLAEAWGPPYQEFTRVAMSTGLPALVGWEYHLVQRGQEPAAIAERRDDLERLYRATDVEEARRVLARWNIAWVFCGTEEERAYGPGVNERLARLAPALVPAFRSGGTAVYRAAP